MFHKCVVGSLHNCHNLRALVWTAIIQIREGLKVIPPTLSREICSFERKWRQVSVVAKIKCLGNFSDKSAKGGRSNSWHGVERRVGTACGSLHTHLLSQALMRQATNLMHSVIICIQCLDLRYCVSVCVWCAWGHNRDMVKKKCYFCQKV